MEIVDDVYAAIDHIHQHGRHAPFLFMFVLFCMFFTSGYSIYLNDAYNAWGFTFIGSSHTDCIITEDKEVADIFLRQVDRFSTLLEI